MQAHSGAASVQIVICGFMRLGLSNAPARMKVRCGLDSALLNNCVPQVGAKSALHAVTAVGDAFKPFHLALHRDRVSAEADAHRAISAPRYWQTRHQQTRAARGAPVTEKRTDLQQASARCGHGSSLSLIPSE